MSDEKLIELYELLKLALTSVEEKMMRDRRKDNVFDLRKLKPGEDPF